MKDVISDYWLNFKLATVELDESEGGKHILKSKFANVTIHDVSPAYSNRIFRAANALRELEIPFGFAVIPKFRGEAQNDISNNQKWLKQILDYDQDIMLHGLYHEDKSGKIEDFHNYAYEDARDHLDKGAEIFSKADIKTDAFIPPTWAVNKSALDALISTGFAYVETDQEILLPRKYTRLHTVIINWDGGSTKLNALLVPINRRAYRDKVMNNCQLLRLAIHPKDDERALDDQVQMLRGLKQANYNFLRYPEVIQLFG